MKKSKLFDAIAQIDDRFVDRCLQDERAAAEKNDEKTLPSPKSVALKKAALIAVSVALILAISMSVTIFLSNRPRDSIVSDHGLNIGFDDLQIENRGAKLVVQTEKSKIQVGEDLPVSFYCICGAEEEYAQNAPKTATAEILMSYTGVAQDKIVETVQKINDATTRDYTWNGSFESIKNEQMVVSTEIFSKGYDSINSSNGGSGVLVWALEVEKKYADGSKKTDQDSVALYYQIVGDEIYLTPGDETLMLARSAVQKMGEGVCFFGSSRVDETTQSVYDHVKWVAPETITLETRNDAAIALIKVYEELLAEYRSLDLERVYRVAHEDYELLNKLIAEGRRDEYQKPVYDDEFLRTFYLGNVRRVIEALLSLDCYYDQLDEPMIERMLTDFEEYAAVKYAAQCKIFDDATPKVLFYMYRKTRNTNEHFISWT